MGLFGVGRPIIHNLGMAHGSWIPHWALADPWLRVRPCTAKDCRDSPSSSTSARYFRHGRCRMDEWLGSKLGKCGTNLIQPSVQPSVQPSAKKNGLWNCLCPCFELVRGFLSASFSHQSLDPKQFNKCSRLSWKPKYTYSPPATDLWIYKLDPLLFWHEYRSKSSTPPKECMEVHSSTCFLYPPITQCAEKSTQI